ncbi:hypothetical protein ACLB2K_067772 [Fragaria x ananassa]
MDMAFMFQEKDVRTWLCGSLVLSKFNHFSSLKADKADLEARPGRPKPRATISKEALIYLIFFSLIQGSHSRRGQQRCVNLERRVVKEVPFKSVDNAGVIVNPNGEMKVTAWSAINGPIGKECADLWPRIASAANVIV